jgi:hypothetical protein
MSNDRITQTARIPRHAWTLAALLVLAILGGGSGCATRRQVEEIVARSNAVMLETQLGVGLDLLTNTVPGATGPAVASDASAKIDAFIDAHADQPETVAALRIRQGVLLLSQRRFNLARAAFNAAPGDHLHTDRDVALKRLSEPLIWWGENSLLNPFPAALVPAAQAAMRAFDAEIQRLGRSGSPSSLPTRDLLAEIRAWIALTVARRADDFPTMKSRLEEAMSAYGSILTEADKAALLAPGGRDDATTVTQEQRRRLRARAVLSVARERVAELEREGLHPDFGPGALSSLLHSPPPH